jgi:hypothetical protein
MGEAVHYCYGCGMRDSRYGAYALKQLKEYH